MAGNQQREVQRVEQMAGGKGHVLIERLLGEKELDGKCRMYAKVTLEPGCSIGYHEHHKESETYYILSGTGRYQDDDRFEEVAAGAVTFTGDGHGHGLANTGTENLVFMALIIWVIKKKDAGAIFRLPRHFFTRSCFLSHFL